MKKIPILLSTLTLASGGATALGANLLSVSAISADETVASQDVLHTESNIYDEMVQMEVKPLEGSLSMRFQMPAEEWVYRIIVVEHDYEKGITEEQANAKLATLGVEDYTTWAKKITEFQEKLNDKYASRVDSIGTSLTQDDMRSLSEGRPNIFYYAVQFVCPLEDENGQRYFNDSDAYWIRGKIDLRNCTRSQNNYSYTNVCTPSKRVHGEKYNFVVRMSNGTILEPTDSNAISWDQEWRRILIDRQENLTRNVSILKDNVLNGPSLIEEYEPQIKDVKRLMGDNDDYRSQVNELNYALGYLKEVKEYYQNQAGANSEELDSLKVKNQELTTTVDNLTQEKQVLTDENDNLRQEKQLLAEANGLLQQEKQTLMDENGNLTHEKQVLMDEKAALEAENQRLKEASANSGANDSYQKELKKMKEKFEAEIKALEQENAELKGQCSLNSDSDKNEGDQNNSDKNDGNQSGLNQDVADNGQQIPSSSNNNQTGVNFGTVSAVNGSTSGNASESALERPNEAEGQKEDNSAENKESVSKGDLRAPGSENAKNDEIEVPQLGAVETKSWLWWLILPMMGILMVGVALKRIFAKKSLK